MNRKARRAAAKQAGLALSPAGQSNPSHGASADDVYAAAISQYRNGAFVQAENLCRLALSRDPRHRRSLVLLGDVVQQGGRNKQAVKLLTEALALNCADAAAHDTIAIAYQALGRRDEAVRHFTDAMALGLRDPEMLVKQCAPVAALLKCLSAAWPRQPTLAELFGAADAATLADEALLLALLQSKVVHDVELERLLIALRRALLQHVIAGGDGSDADYLELFCALAQQCFLNEYVFACGDAEQAQVRQVQDRIASAVGSNVDVAPLDVIVIASYQPLHSLTLAHLLPTRPWPNVVDRVLQRQLREPMQELSDRLNIPSLTTVDDSTSLSVQNQYEENPYPRWVIVPPITPTTVADYLREELGESPVVLPSANLDILVAGCGTGAHSIDTALRFPQTRVLAVDISRASLAYARRKSRELGLTNIDYGQADILKLAALDQRFDVIEAVGVLHHLADPAAGWRRLLSLLRPHGLMLVGLYSATARQSLNAARTFIAERGYRATADDIRNCRHELIQRFGTPPFRDFSSLSGCRDLLFNVMEHEFTITQIAAFIDANGLSFLGFTQLPPATKKDFRQEFPATGAWQDFDAWASFERKHPLTFGNMYIFWVQKRGDV